MIGCFVADLAAIRLVATRFFFFFTTGGFFAGAGAAVAFAASSSPANSADVRAAGAGARGDEVFDPDVAIKTISVTAIEPAPPATSHRRLGLSAFQRRTSLGARRASARTSSAPCNIAPDDCAKAGPRAVAATASSNMAPEPAGRRGGSCNGGVSIPGAAEDASETVPTISIADVKARGRSLGIAASVRMDPIGGGAAVLGWVVARRFARGIADIFSNTGRLSGWSCLISIRMPGRANRFSALVNASNTTPSPHRAARPSVRSNENAVSPPTSRFACGMKSMLPSQRRQNLSMNSSTLSHRVAIRRPLAW
ncbi:MAG TPA: hypothetical protein VIV40_40000 [Kofleriaceae bacterium]